MATNRGEQFLNPRIVVAENLVSFKNVWELFADI